MKIYEGTIITCDANDRVVRFLVEDGGKIIYTGDLLPEQYGPAPRMELGCRALLPSFSDTHIHFASFSLFNSGLDVRTAGTIDEMSDIIRDYIRKNNKGLILGFGASPYSVLEKRMITRSELDAVSPNRPVFIAKYDGHACILNTVMMKMLPEKISSMRGYHEDTGEMNQEAYFAATDFATSKVSPLRVLDNMIKGVDTMASRGIGLMHTVSGVGFPRDIDVDLERIFARGLNSGFQSRVFFQTMNTAQVNKRRLPRIGGCFETALDGCFGSVDAALQEPYSHDPENRGVLFYSDEEVAGFVRNANRQGLQIEIHAIGDRAFDQAVRAFSMALKDFPRDDHRHGIIHSCLPTEAGMEKCSELGIQIPLQPSFLHWNLEPLDYLEKILGERVNEISPLRTMADMGILISGGSDGPCTIPDPIHGIWSAVNHYIPGQSLTVPEALKLYTFNGAWASFDEKERGSLEVGKVADMVILSENPLEVNPKDLRRLRVESLLLAGNDYTGGQSKLSVLSRGLLHPGSC